MTNGEKFKEVFGFGVDGSRVIAVNSTWWDCDFQNSKPITSVPLHGRLKKCVVYRGDVFNALESARIIALDGILTDRYKDGFHDGLKRALEILANEVQDVPIIIEAEEGECDCKEIFENTTDCPCDNCEKMKE